MSVTRPCLSLAVAGLLGACMALVCRFSATPGAGGDLAPAVCRSNCRSHGYFETVSTGINGDAVSAPSAMPAAATSIFDPSPPLPSRPRQDLRGPLRARPETFSQDPARRPRAGTWAFRRTGRQADPPPALTGPQLLQGYRERLNFKRPFHALQLPARRECRLRRATLRLLRRADPSSVDVSWAAFASRSVTPNWMGNTPPRAPPGASADRRSSPRATRWARSPKVMVRRLAKEGQGRRRQDQGRRHRKASSSPKRPSNAPCSTASARWMIIRAYRICGHLIADIDLLGMRDKTPHAGTRPAPTAASPKRQGQVRNRRRT